MRRVSLHVFGWLVPLRWQSWLLIAAFFIIGGPMISVRGENSTGATGSGALLENRQPGLVMRYIIATQGIFPDDVPQSTPNQQSPPYRDDPFLGEIKAVPFNFAPKGWMLCEGQLLPINQNQALFSLLLTTYGGNGVTTFALPDLRNRVPIGAGQGPGLPNYALGQQIGNASPQLTRGNLPPHAHTLPNGITDVAGNGVPFDNRQACLALNFLIASNGEIMIVPWPQLPTGWGRCDGRLLSAANHALLFTNIGTTYGGDSTNFALPDLRGRVVVGDDNGGSWPRGLSSGSNDIVLNIADMPSHFHTITSGVTGSTGGTGNTANNYQPSLVLRWLISFTGIFPSPTSGGGSPFVAELRLIAGQNATGLSPSTWKLSDGTLYSISENDALFNLVGDDYGGDGQETFGVPDLRGRVNLALAGGMIFADNVGSATLLLSPSELPPHSHLIDLGISAIQHFEDGSALITLRGMAGTSVKVDKADTIGTWSTLGTVQFVNSTATITDPNPSPSAETRFYRAR